MEVTVVMIFVRKHNTDTSTESCNGATAEFLTYHTDGVTKHRHDQPKGLAWSDLSLADVAASQQEGWL